jgi:hypothetical protein
MARYNPPTKVVATEIPYLAMVVRDDPSWARLKYNEIEYEFAGKAFRANPYARGAYHNPHQN